jgi:alpha-beta hydrolase superfamily lysophospholipase
MTSIPFTWQNAKAITITAEDWSPQAEPRAVVVLVHGLGEHIGRYRHVAEALNAAGIAMLGFDLPGHGRSGGARGHASFDAILDDIDHLLQEAARRYPGKPRFLYGHSMGGALVLYYTLKRRPDLQGVIASAPGLASGVPLPSSKLFMAKVMSKLAPTYTMDNGLDLTYLSTDPAVIKAYKADPLVHPKISARLGNDLLSTGEWVLAHAAEFPLPLLVFQGAGDRIVSVAFNTRFARAVPKEKVTYKLWEGLYHEAHNDPEQLQVIQSIIDWINSHL